MIVDLSISQMASVKKKNGQKGGNVVACSVDSIPQKKNRPGADSPQFCFENMASQTALNQSEHLILVRWMGLETQ